MRNREVCEILTTAKDIVETRGWCQDDLEDDLGRVCMLGALQYARRTVFPSLEAYDEAKATIYRVINNGSIVTFNDTPSRTKEQVLAAFDRAIEAVL